MGLTRRRLLAAALGLPLAGVPYARAADADLANGIFLIASPELQDPNFRETVVLITQPEAGGGQLGVIVNRPLAARLSDALPDLHTIPDAAQQIYAGGPYMAPADADIIFTAEAFKVWPEMIKRATQRAT